MDRVMATKEPRHVNFPMGKAQNRSPWAVLSSPDPCSSLSTVSMQQGARSASVPFLSQPKNLDGSMAGDVGFDPLGLSYYVDIKWLREAELKHGRICMLATAGILVQEVVHLPGAQFQTKVRRPFLSHSLHRRIYAESRGQGMCAGETETSRICV